MLQEIEKKLKDLETQLQQSIAHHNFLLGAKASFEAVVATMKSATPVVEEIAEIVDPAAAPAIDATINTIEAVVNAVE